MSAEREVNLGARNFLHVARYVARNQGNWDLAAKDAQQNRALPHIVEALKTATTPGTTTGWGQPLAPYAQLQSSFLAALRSASAFENMLPFLRTVPVGLHNGVVVTSGAAGTTVNEGEVKPITKMAFQTIQMTPKKTTAIAVSTKELLQFGGSDIFAQDLTNSVAAAVDASFVSEITSGISPTTSAGGGSVAPKSRVKTSSSSWISPQHWHRSPSVPTPKCFCWSVLTLQNCGVLSRRRKVSCCFHP